MRGSLDNFQFLHHGGPHALHLCQTGGRGGNHAVEIAENLQKVFGQRFDIAARDGAEQQQFQQFVILQRHTAGPHEAFAQAGAVVVVVGFRNRRRKGDRRAVLRVEQAGGRCLGKIMGARFLHEAEPVAGWLRNG